MPPLRAAVLIVAAFASSGCAEARRDAPPADAAPAPSPTGPSGPSEASPRSPTAPAAATGPAPVTPAAGAPAPSATGPATAAAPPAAVLKVEDAPAASRLVLSVPKRLKLGGFAFLATYDPALVIVGRPEPSEALAGYLCQDNVAVPGTIRYNCAGLPQDERGGVLATLPLRHGARAPVAADFQLVSAEVVDDFGNRVEGLRVAIAVEPAPAPAR